MSERGPECGAPLRIGALEFRCNVRHGTRRPGTLLIHVTGGDTAAYNLDRNDVDGQPFMVSWPERAPGTTKGPGPRRPGA